MTIIYNSNVFDKELVFSGLVVQSGQRTSRSRADNGKYLNLGTNKNKNLRSFDAIFTS